MTLDEALAETGIPLEDFESFFADRMQRKALDHAMLHVAAMHAIKVGVQTLTKIAQDGPRMQVTSRDEDGNTTTMRPISSDLDAAKALVQFGLKARVIDVAVKAQDDKSKPVQADLWDVARLGPWKGLTNPMEQ